MIFQVAYKKGDKHLLKIDTKDKNLKNPIQWMNCGEEVYNYAKTSFEDGDTIGIEYTMKGKLYHVTRINKEGKNAEVKKGAVVEENNADTAQSDTNIEEGYHCSDCGKELKDGKYQKCYTCNQKNPVKPKSTNTSYQRSPETVASIKMQCAYKAACQAITVFIGQIADLDTLKTQIDDLANHIVKNF